MRVTNKTSFPLIAFGWDMRFGYGDDVEIEPGQAAEIPGPFIGEMGGGDCHLSLRGEITCHEGADIEDESLFHVSLGNQLNLQDETRGITVRHYREDRQIDKMEFDDHLHQ